MKYKLPHGVTAALLGFLTAMVVASYSTITQAHHASYHDSGSSHQFNVADAMKNKEIVMMAIGMAVYYQDNCAGLTHQGMRYLNRAIVMHSIDTNTMHEDSQYKIGVKIATSYPACSKLRFAITDAGLGAMIR